MKVNWLGTITAALLTGFGTVVATGVINPGSKTIGIIAAIGAVIQAFQHPVVQTPSGAQANAAEVSKNAKMAI